MKKQLTLFGGVSLYIGLFACIMTQITQSEAKHALAFLAFEVFGVLAVGIAGTFALKIPLKNGIEIVTVGYSLGIANTVLLYFATTLLHIFPYIKIVYGVVVALAVAYLLWLNMRRYQDAIVLSEWDVRDVMVIFVVLSVTLLLRFFSYYCNNVLPSIEQDVVFRKQDLLFYIGNAISSGKGFPVEEFRFAGELFKYHYFGSLNLEVTAKVTGIPEMLLEFRYMWLQAPMLLVMAFWCIARRLQVKGIYCFLGELLLLFTAGFEKITYITFQHIMYVTPFGFDFGLAFGLVSIFLICIQDQGEKIYIGTWIANIVIFMACVGMKAPIAIIILCFHAGICVMWLLQKRRAWAFLYGIGFVVAFLVIFFGIVSDGMSTVTVNATGLRLSLTGHFNECGLGKKYYEWTARGVPGIIAKLLAVAGYFWGANPAVYSIFYLAAFKGLTKMKTLERYDIACLTAVPIGMLFTLFTKQQGNSQMYFAMTTVPLAILFGVAWLTKQTTKNKIQIVFMILCTATSLFCFGRLAMEFRCEDGFEPVSNSITWEEYKAYRWVAENLDPAACIASNVVLEQEQYQSFIVGVASEHQQWMEGWRYVAGYLPPEKISERLELTKELFAGEKTACEAVMASGVQYILLVKRYIPYEVDWTKWEGTLVYSSDSVDVFRLTCN